MAKVLYDPKTMDAPHRTTVFGLDFVGGGDPVDVTDAKALGKFRAWQEHHPELGFAVIDDDTAAGLAAVHRGRGVYGVVSDGEPVPEAPPMSKDDAEAFNAMSAEEKAAFVAKPTE